MNGMIGQFYGTEIREISEQISMVLVLKQVKFPRRKNKRIRARWRNNKKNWAEVKERQAFYTNGVMYADALTIEKLKNAVEKLGEVKPFNSPPPTPERK